MINSHYSFIDIHFLLQYSFSLGEDGSYHVYKSESGMPHKSP
jgi:hypothetical protein